MLELSCYCSVNNFRCSLEQEIMANSSELGCAGLGAAACSVTSSVLDRTRECEKTDRQFKEFFY